MAVRVVDPTEFASIAEDGTKLSWHAKNATEVLIKVILGKKITKTLSMCTNLQLRVYIVFANGETKDVYVQKQHVCWKNPTKIEFTVPVAEFQKTVNLVIENISGPVPVPLLRFTPPNTLLT